MPDSVQDRQMGLLDLLAGAGFMVGGVLAGAGFNLMAPPHGLHSAAKWCFMIAALVFAATGLMWGINTHMGFPVRAVICGSFGAIALIGAVEGWRLAAGQQGTAQAATPSPTNPPSPGGGVTITGTSGGQAGATIQNNGPVYNGAVTVNHPIKVTRESLNEGVLIPANLPDPPHPPMPAPDPVIEKLGLGIPKDAFKFYYGGNLSWFKGGNHKVLEMGGESMIELNVDPTKRQIAITLLRIFDDRDNIIARLDEDGFWVENSTRNKRPDKHTLVVFDHLDHEVLRIVFLNPHSIVLTGTFRNPKTPTVVQVLNDRMMIGGNTFSGSITSGGGKADIGVR